MHHHHFVIALAAVSLIYCGGAPVETSQCGVSTTTTDSVQSPPIDTADIRIFNEIFSKDGACLESNFQTGYRLNELLFVRENAFSFPFEDGSYLLLLAETPHQKVRQALIRLTPFTVTKMARLN